jgi:two-component system, NtrC family, response regulator AtoC
MTNPLHLLLVEDDPLERRLLEMTLGRTHRLTIECAASGEEALDCLANTSCDAVMTDLMMPGMNGIDLIRRIRAYDSGIPIIVVTANAAVERAVEGMRAGATEYLVKPIDSAKVMSFLERTRRDRATPPEHDDALSRLFAGDHPKLERVRSFARRIAAVPSSRVLITGESGTGKSLLARAIHELSGEAGQFVVVNCATLPTNLLESELFGHEKGAFTDARTAKRGLIELARGGTLFLDEIGAMPLELQAKLLLFLENHDVRRLGGIHSQTIPTRVVVATNENLHERVRNRTFRADLFYRLDVASIELPSLREMPGVVVQFVDRTLREIADQLGRAVPELDARSLSDLVAYPWPGNVRELRNVVERALVLHEEGPLHLSPAAPAEPVSEGDGCVIPHGLPLRAVERRYLEATIARHPGADYVSLAGMLGISRKTLWEKRRRYEL